jgi:diphosphomevalonate decarboxylase
MTRKVTVVAPSNIALIKYWGTRDRDRTLPFNSSLSMTLRECATRTTVEAIPGQQDDVLVADDAGQLRPAEGRFAQGVCRHLDRLRSWAGVAQHFRVATRNSFPMGAGMASSASGFAALAMSVTAALEREVSAEQASVLARESGSGSAARSVMGGYVEWPDEGSEGAAVQVLPAEHWDLRDVIAILDSTEKRVSSREGHRLAETSPYFEPRLHQLPERLEGVRRALQECDFAALAPLVEEEAIDLHLIAMSSRPPIFYWRPGTLIVLEMARALRDTGIDVCATMDAGANVHLICTPEAEPTVVDSMNSLPEVQRVIRDGVGEGPHLAHEPLF